MSVCHRIQIPVCGTERNRSKGWAAHVDGSHAWIARHESIEPDSVASFTGFGRFEVLRLCSQARLWPHEPLLRSQRPTPYARPPKSGPTIASASSNVTYGGRRRVIHAHAKGVRHSAREGAALAIFGPPASREGPTRAARPRLRRVRMRRLDRQRPWARGTPYQQPRSTSSH